jgi:O-antigen/teichoic acid export membrane protein
LTDTAPPRRPTRRRFLLDTLWNLSGNAIPLLAGLAAIPPLVSALGVERFGLLTLIWMLIGYFSLLDMGMGRALTQLVAAAGSAGEGPRNAAMIRTAVRLVASIGVAGGAVLALATPLLVEKVLTVSREMQPEARNAIYLSVLSLPVTVLTTALRGALEGLRRFAVVNMLRVPLGIATFLVPLLVAWVTPDLAAIAAGLFVVRALGLLAHWIACRSAFPALAMPSVPEPGTARSLIGFGGWMTVSNVIGPLMVYMDRFAIGAVATLAAVAYYTTPYEIVTKLWIIPAALTATLFPALAGSRTEASSGPARLLSQSTAATFACLFPAVALVVAFAREALSLWLGEEFAGQSYRVAQWLAAGVLINSLALIPFTYIQARGRPDITAKLHLLELPFYLAALWWMLEHLGIEGAAIAWTARVALDALAIGWMAVRMEGEQRWVSGRLASVMLLGIAVLPLVAAPAEVIERFLLAVTASLAFPFAALRLARAR